MAAYWLARARVTDPVRWRAYADLATPVALAHGAKFIGAGDFKVLEGQPWAEFFLVVEYPSMERAEACYRSEGYQAASKLRDGAGDLEVVIVDGGSLERLETVTLGGGS